MKSSEKGGVFNKSMAKMGENAIVNFWQKRLMAVGETPPALIKNTPRGTKMPKKITVSLLLGCRCPIIGKISSSDSSRKHPQKAVIFDDLRKNHCFSAGITAGITAFF